MGVSPRSKKEAFAVPFAVTCVLKVKNTAALSGVVRPPVDSFWNGRDTICSAALGSYTTDRNYREI